MKLKNKIVGGLLKMKNRQLRAEREKSRALDETNSILSAYVASLIEERGGARIAKDQIRSAIGKYSAQVIADGADYVISVIRNGKAFDESSSRVAAKTEAQNRFEQESLAVEKEDQENADV